LAGDFQEIEIIEIKRVMMKETLLIIFTILFLVNNAIATPAESLKEYIRANTNITESSLKYSEQKNVKLATFSNADMKIRFLVDSYKDELAIAVKIEDSDTIITFGNSGKSHDIGDSYSHPDTGLEETFNLKFGDCSYVFTDKSETCIRVALIDSVVKQNHGNEHGSKEFLNKMAQMNFKIERILVNTYLFDVGTNQYGCHPLKVQIYVSNEKPIALLEKDILCVDP
jgi:hypothetical protein